jgi:NADPH:quinone reductase
METAVSDPTMRAVVVDEFGGTPHLAEVPRPVAGPGQLLIRVEAAGINPWDLKVADGFMADRAPHDFPLILGTDLAGVVEVAGDGVERFAPGDRVAGKFIGRPIGHGTFAEYVVVPADGTVATVPDGISGEQAAALPIAGLTALDLYDVLEPVDGRTVLVVGASGGVGSFVVQLLAAGGARVIATARPDDAERLRGLGVAETVDYTAGQVAEAVRESHPDGVDLLVDMVSAPDALSALLPAVARGGRAWSTTWSADESALAELGLTGGNFESPGRIEQLERLLAKVADKSLVVPLGRALPLTDGPDALAAFRSGGTRGKTVLVP